MKSKVLAVKSGLVPPGAVTNKYNQTHPNPYQKLPLQHPNPYQKLPLPPGMGVKTSSSNHPPPPVMNYHKGQPYPMKVHPPPKLHEDAVKFHLNNNYKSQSSNFDDIESLSPIKHKAPPPIMKPQVASVKQSLSPSKLKALPPPIMKPKVATVKRQSLSPIKKPAIAKVVNKKPGQFKCSKCASVFDSRRNLTEHIHMERRTGVRPT